MNSGFVLHVWGDERGDKRLKAYGPNLTAADLRDLVVDVHADHRDSNNPDDFDDPDMLESSYTARPGCEAALARLFNVEPLEGRYHVGSATWQRPEPDEVLEQRFRDWVKDKTRIDGMSLSIFGGEEEKAHAYSTTVKPADVIPYLQGVDVNDDPRLEGAQYHVQPGAEATVAAMFGLEPVEGQYTVATTYWYE